MWIELVLVLVVHNYVDMCCEEKCMEKRTALPCYHVIFFPWFLCRVHICTSCVPLRINRFPPRGPFRGHDSPI
jgi:hypothetical protein